MKIIDGSQGEGGGQILRTALSLSMCLQQPICVQNIRARRERPGLLRQHLTCVRAAREICTARLIGDEIGSEQLEFHPGNIRAGNYHFSVGTAGSTSLVFQTVLPALLQAKTLSTVLFEGGTHNRQAPSFDFIEQSFLPLLNDMGFQVKGELLQHGFYPNGGGQWQAKIWPMEKNKPLSLLDRGELLGKVAVASSARIPEHVARRELNQVQKKCAWPGKELQLRQVNSCGPGNILSLRLFFNSITEVFEAVGELGISAERVAGVAIRDMQRYLKSDAVVAERLSDQLLLPLVLGKGGEFTTLKPSLHTMTNMNVIQSMMDCQIELTKIKDDEYKISVHK